jgi:hypothetical protein
MGLPANTIKGSGFGVIKQNRRNLTADSILGEDTFLNR